MSKNHTIRGCKDLEKKPETGNFLYVDHTIATFVCHSIRENSENEVAKGPFTFYEMGGGGGVGFGGVTPKKRLKSGGHPKQTEGRRGGHAKYFIPFFPDFLRAQNVVRVIEGKIIWK